MKHLSSAAFSKRNFAFGMSPLALLTLSACGGGGSGGGGGGSGVVGSGGGCIAAAAAAVAEADSAADEFSCCSRSGITRGGLAARGCGA